MNNVRVRHAAGAALYLVAFHSRAWECVAHRSIPRVRASTAATFLWT